MDGSLTSSLSLLGLLMAAIAIGFFLGRRDRGARRARQGGGSYMRGLNYLLSEKADSAIDAFVGTLDVNDDTVDTHLALGALVRRRGEVDKAIRVHQNLLARPRLSPRFRAQAELELARDYLAAGLLGRAESLLKELASRGGELRESALEFLLEIYQRERDWEEAIAIAREMANRGERDIRRTLAHYLCELADRAWESGEVRDARAHLEQALEWDARCVRASLMLGRLESEQGRWKDAIRALRRVQEQDPRFLAEALPVLTEAHAQLGTERDLVRFLERCVELTPSATVAAHLADRIATRSGESAARDFLAGALAERPNVRGLGLLLGRHLHALNAPLESAARGEGGAAAESEASGDVPVAKLADALGQLKEFVDALVAESPSYECEGCGFSGRVLHWQCPSCKSWGTMAPVRGLVGE
ncbi:MAG TPA: lipopolysaccharide assembly protein LapB [Pseudomonadales bacterium]|nr:lipopolysaccharide assembly protein LapB [Pseudomonadales bacterium]